MRLSAEGGKTDRALVERERGVDIFHEATRDGHQVG